MNDEDVKVMRIELSAAVDALRSIASYNAPELREWEEENAADMCEEATKFLAIYGYIEGIPRHA